MNLTLKRNLKREDGIFGTLVTPTGKVLAVTLEHAYADGKGSFIPKLPSGVYECVFGAHLLSGMTSPFETFEITNVPGHTGILFHWGNFNGDSEGCVLVGETIQCGPDGAYMVTKSRDAWRDFMRVQGDQRFTLTVA